MGVRDVGGDGFRYNAEVSAALVPALIVLAGSGGQVVMGTLLVGMMVTYILDALQYREGSFAALWITLVALQMGMLMSNGVFSPLRLFGFNWVPWTLTQEYSSPFLALLQLLVAGQTMAVTGCWGTLQFKWVQEQYPVAAIALEKLVIQAATPVGVAVQAWGLLAAVGAEAAPYYLAVMLCAAYYIFCLPMSSSFSTGKGARAAVRETIQSPAVSGMTAGLVILLPAGLHIFMRSAALVSWVNFWSLLLLLSLPIVWICALEKGMWWLGPPSPAKVFFQKGLAMLALGALIAGLEGRVVFRSFEQYINIHPPWSYIVITAGLYGGAAVVVLHFMGVLGRQLETSIAGVVLVLCSAAGCFAVGVPVTIMPAPLCAAAGVSLFYDSRSFRDYCIFFAGAVLTCAWFVHHYFWFLEINMGKYTVRHACGVVMALLLPSLSIPGLLLSGMSSRLTSFLLAVQAFLVAIAEEQLYAGTHGEELMYPSFMVLLTTALGLAITHKLQASSFLARPASWVCHSAYIAKLGMLLVPEAYMVQPALMFALAASAPVMLYSKGDNRGRRVKLPGWQLLLHAVSIVAAVVFGRFAVFDAIQWLTSSRPSEAVAAGALLLAIAAGCVPLVARHYSSAPNPCSSLIAVAALGMLLILLRPPFPVRSGAKCPHLPFGLCPRLWDEAHAPFHEIDDVNIYGIGEGRRTHPAVWLLVIACFSGLLLASPSARSAGQHISMQCWPGKIILKYLIASLSASCVACYIAFEFFQHCAVLQVLLMLSLLVVASAVVSLQLSPGGLNSAIFGIALWLISFPLALLAEASSPLPPLPKASLRLYPDSALDVAIERHALRRDSLLAVYAAQAILLAFVIKLKMPSLLTKDAAVGAGNGSTSAAGFICYDSLLQGFNVPGMCLPGGGVFPKRSGMLDQRSGGTVGWVAAAGNVSCLLAVFLVLMISVRTGGVMDISAFVLSPLLLLLNQDNLFFTGLTTARRYFPPAAAAVVYLGASAANQILETTAFVSPESSHALRGSRPTVYLLRNTLCLLACLPTHASFLKYIWEWIPQSDSQLLYLTPLNLIALCLSDLETVRLLAVAGMVASCIQHLSMRQRNRIAMRII